MARRKDHSRDQIKQLALNAALSLIQTEGLNALTARAVAKKIGYTVGTLYNVFTNFDDLILHLNVKTMASLELALEGEKNIYLLTQRYIQFAHAHPNEWRLLFEARQSELIPSWYSQQIDALFMLVETALLPYLNYSSAQASMAAKVLWSGLYGICFLSINGKLDTILGETAQTIGLSFVENYLAGLARQK